MTGTKTNERPGTRAQVRYLRMSASKARVVLDLIRGKSVAEASQILAFSDRLAATEIAKVMRSAVANAQHNDEQSAEELMVSACFADEGPTLKRFRPRARGRAGRINKRTCHITVIVSRMDDEVLDRMRDKAAGRTKAAGGSADRRARVARSRGEEVAATPAPADADDTVETDVVDTHADNTDADNTDADNTDAANTTDVVVDETGYAETADEMVEQIEDAGGDVDVPDVDSEAQDTDDDGAVNASDDSPYGDGSHALIDGDPDQMPEGFPIKGNDDSKLYHNEDSPFYGRTKAEVWFTTDEAAEAAGFSKPESQIKKEAAAAADEAAEAEEGDA